MLCITTAYNYVAAGVLNSYNSINYTLMAMRIHYPAFLN